MTTVQASIAIDGLNNFCEKIMKVYLVMGGDYSGDNIIGIYKDKTKALEIANKRNQSKDIMDYDNYGVSEYELK